MNELQHVQLCAANCWLPAVQESISQEGYRIRIWPFRKGGWPHSNMFKHALRCRMGCRFAFTI